MDVLGTIAKHRQSFARMNLPQKKAFIEELQLKLKGKFNPDYTKFLSECISVYNAEIKGGGARPATAAGQHTGYVPSAYQQQSHPPQYQYQQSPYYTGVASPLSADKILFFVLLITCAASIALFFLNWTTSAFGSGSGIVAEMRDTFRGIQELSQVDNSLALSAFLTSGVTGFVTFLIPLLNGVAVLRLLLVMNERNVERRKKVYRFAMVAGIVTSAIVMTAMLTINNAIGLSVSFALITLLVLSIGTAIAAFVADVVPLNTTPSGNGLMKSGGAVYCVFGVPGLATVIGVFVFASATDVFTSDTAVWAYNIVSGLYSVWCLFFGLRMMYEGNTKGAAASRNAVSKRNLAIANIVIVAVALVALQVIYDQIDMGIHTIVMSDVRSAAVAFSFITAAVLAGMTFAGAFLNLRKHAPPPPQYGNYPPPQYGGY